MNRPLRKSSLSEAQSCLVALLQIVNFGRIEGLQIRAGQPIFDPPPLVVRKLRTGADNQRRPEADLEDFYLKEPVIEMLDALADLRDGEVRSIDVRHGLPISIEIEYTTNPSGGLHYA